VSRERRVSFAVGVGKKGLTVSGKRKKWCFFSEYARRSSYGDWRRENGKKT